MFEQIPEFPDLWICHHHHAIELRTEVEGVQIYMVFKKTGARVGPVCYPDGGNHQFSHRWLDRWDAETRARYLPLLEVAEARFKQWDRQFEVPLGEYRWPKN